MAKEAQIDILAAKYFDRKKLLNKQKLKEKRELWITFLLFDILVL